MKVAVLKTRPIKPSFISWAIRKVQGTNYSHYAIDVNGSVIDATRKDVRPQSYEDFFKHNKVVEITLLEIDADFETVIYPWMISVSNRGYGFLQILGILLKQFGWIKFNPFGADSKRLICNELVLLFLQKFCKVVLEKDIDQYDLVMTGEILKGVEDVSNPQ